MYVCNNCEHTFDMPKAVYERHGFNCPPYERRAVCPDCGSEEFEEKPSIPAAMMRDDVLKHTSAAAVHINHLLYQIEASPFVLETNDLENAFDEIRNLFLLAAGDDIRMLDTDISDRFDTMTNEDEANKLYNKVMDRIA